MKILVFGASSAIAMAFSRLYAEKHAELILVGRNQEKLEECQKDLLTRGAKTVSLHLIDIENTHKEDLEKLPSLVDIIFCAHGILGDQEELSSSFEAREKLVQINFVSNLHILSYFKSIWKEHGHQASIAVISSVAADRGRYSNYYYGASKAALSTFKWSTR